MMISNINIKENIEMNNLHEQHTYIHQFASQGMTANIDIIIMLG